MKKYKNKEQQEEYEEFLNLSDSGYVDVALWIDEMPEENIVDLLNQIYKKEKDD